MNALDQHIQEVVFKIDNEDLVVLNNALNLWGNRVSTSNVEDKMKTFALRKLRQKFEVKIAQTKGSIKTFKMRIEPIQAYALMNILSVMTDLYKNEIYEANVCRKYRDEFHQGLMRI